MLTLLRLRRFATTATGAAAGAPPPSPAWLVKQIDAGMAEQRLDRLLRTQFRLPQALVQKLLRKGQVLVNDARGSDAHQRLAEGDVVRVPRRYALRPLRPGTAPTPLQVTPEDRQLLRNAVVYSDRDLLVLNKPYGIATQGGHRVAKHVDGMLHVLQDDDAAERPRLVHRLDMDTTGCLLVAKSRASAARLQEFIRDARRIHKTYFAFVIGVPKHSTGRINHPVKRVTAGDVERMVLADPDEASVPTEGLHVAGRRNRRDDGDDLYTDFDDSVRQRSHHGHKMYKANVWQAVTDYTVLHEIDRLGAALRLEPLTGRKHQLRLHCAAVLQTPILGDVKYGDVAARSPEAFHSVLGAGPQMMHLHLKVIRLIEWFPDGSDLIVEAPLPAHMRATWSALGLPSPK